MPPFFTIITSTYNAEKALPPLLESLASQTCHDFNWIVQDGSSSDATMQIVEQYRNRLPEILADSRKDRGIYDAWNKALDQWQARLGKWIIFMGAGDTFCHQDSLKEAMHYLEQLSDEYIYYAVPVEIVLCSGEFLNQVAPSNNPSIDLKNGMCLPHQGLFHRHDIFSNNRYDISYSIAGDYDFVCRTLTRNNICFGKTACIRMSVGGVSSSLAYMTIREAEFFNISRKFYSSSIPLKIIARFSFWKCITLISHIFGKRTACAVADIPRILQKKPRLWSLEQCPPSLPILPPKPHLALCIATVGRVTELDRLLTSLEQQTCTAFHIYLADQNAPGTLDAMLQKHADLQITRILLPSRGVSTARNALLSLIGEEEFIIFPDDDCWYAPDTLAQVAEAFQRHPQAGTVMGKSIDTSPVSPPCGQDTPVSQIGTFKNGETYLQFFRAEVVKDLRFDPRLGPGTGLPYGCGEDTDYLLEAHKRAPVWRCPSIRVFHPSPDTHVPSDAKIASYAAGRMYLLKKHAFPLWFRCANVLYPLCMLPLDALRKGRKAARYRWRMFVERLRHFSS
ncbi:glycosyltransferase family 2 protein [Desulfovibrio piger]|uniref:Glycosyltransferase n=1 Tax=Desulfovibrio piger TaxID=901 RepID=A0A1K1LEY8_9BACT|nr:glycosyltransferase [Desulfovibrio piger]SFV73269.1 Glycosyltransferase [Desulfovibrio piger]